jgi:tetrahydromethanopterin S-methyltransferase subunit B
MNTNKLIGIILLVLGAVLIYFGLNATESPTEEIAEAVTGRYTDKTMYYLIGGAVSAVLGLVLAVKK